MGNYLFCFVQVLQFGTMTKQKFNLVPLPKIEQELWKLRLNPIANTCTFLEIVHFCIPFAFVFGKIIQLTKTTGKR